MTEQIKLNLACGELYLPGYVNIDNQSMYNGKEMKVDKIADIFKLQWEKGSVDEIVLCHFMMYVPIQKADKFLRRLYSWLKPGGKLIIETGDLKKVCKRIIDSHDSDEINKNLMQIFGWEGTRGHKWAWCEDNLIDILVDGIGFSHVQYADGGIHGEPMRDMTLYCTK